MNQYLATLAVVALLGLLAWVHAGAPTSSSLIKSALMDTRNKPLFSIERTKSKRPSYGKPT